MYSGIIQEGREQVSCWSHGHKKEKRREEERKGWGGGLGERGSVMSELLKKKQTLIPLPSPRSSALPFAKSSDISSLHSTAAR